MVTALSEPADRVRGLEAGADDFLTKPVNDIALFARVRSLVRLRRMMEEWRHREDVYGRFSALIDEEHSRRRGSQAPARILLWEESAFAAPRIAEMLAPLASEMVRPAVARGFACRSAMPVDRPRDPQHRRQGRRAAHRRQAARARTSRLVPILLIADPDELPRVAKGLDLGATDYLLRPLDRNELLARVPHPDPPQAAAGPAAGELSEEPVAGADRRPHRPLQPPLSHGASRRAAGAASPRARKGPALLLLRHRLVQARQRHLRPCRRRRGAARGGGARRRATSAPSISSRAMAARNSSSCCPRPPLRVAVVRGRAAAHGRRRAADRASASRRSSSPVTISIGARGDRERATRPRPRCCAAPTRRFMPPRPPAATASPAAPRTCRSEARWRSRCSSSWPGLTRPSTDLPTAGKKMDARLKAGLTRNEAGRNVRAT